MSTTTVTKENWWALVLGGVATVIFGVAAIFWPGLTLTTLLYLFSTYVLISGVVTIMAGVSSVEKLDWWFLPVALGAFELGTGVYLLRNIDVAFSTFILLIGFVLVARGVVEAVGTFYNSRLAAKARTMSYVNSLGALAAGIVIMFAEEANGVDFVWILGLYALVIGTLNITELSSGASK